MTDEATPNECECCQFSPVAVKSYRDHFENRDRYYCELCAGSLASTYSRGGRPDAPVLQTICYVGNAILAAIRGEG